PPPPSPPYTLSLHDALPISAFPRTEIQERVPDSENIRTFRVSLNLLGDGFVEAVPDQTFVDLAKDQCQKNHNKICGQVLYVPILDRKSTRLNSSHLGISYAV